MQQESDDADESAALDTDQEALPHQAAMVASELHDDGEDPPGWCDHEAEFEFTLDRYSTASRATMPDHANRRADRLSHSGSRREVIDY